MANKKVIRNLILIYFMCSGSIHCHMLLLFFKLLHFLQDVGFFLFFFFYINFLQVWKASNHSTHYLAIFYINFLQVWKDVGFFQAVATLQEVNKKSKRFLYYIILYRYCRVTNYGPNPKRVGYRPNKPNTINL